jgi:hypothetical protein
MIWYAIIAILTMGTVAAATTLSVLLTLRSRQLEEDIELEERTSRTELLDVVFARTLQT